jgi:hypothetical protein
VRLHGNEVRGSFGLGGIVASEGIDSAMPVSFDARVYNNVVVGSGGGTGIRPGEHRQINGNSSTTR